MHVFRPFAALLPLLSPLLVAQDPVPSDAPDRTPSDFVRFVKVGDGGHLDTAITTYKKGDVELFLFGAVHIADAACYATLNDRFTTCDVLLYELVGPADYRPTKDREAHGFNPISLLQQGLKNMLELSFQLDEIDYQAPNFVHADMTPEEFAASMEQRGESLLTIMFDMMMQGQKLQREKAEQAEDAGKTEPAPQFDLVKAFQQREGHHQLRMTLAPMMEEIELMSVGGPEGGTLLEGRNEKCLAVLQRELAAGKKRIGIYYGAAHYPHMERRIVQDLGFQKIGHEWIVAWDCNKRLDAKYDREVTKARRRCRDDLAALAEIAKDYRAAHDEPGKVPTVQDLAAFAPAGGEPYKGAVKDPWGNAYVVRKRPTGSRWEIASAGQDGAMGTDDDLTAVEARRGGLSLFR